MSDILILNLSSMPRNSANVTESDYSSDMGKIKGTYTNDAPVKYILKFLNNQGKNLNKILCAVTNEAESAFEKYTETVVDFCTENNYSIPEIIKVKSNFSSSDMALTVKKMLEYIDRNDRIYLDTTGGSRNASYLLMFVVRFLEYEGIKLEKAVYSVFASKEIEDVTELYNMFNLINSANTFTSFGNSVELAEYFKDTRNELIKKVISAMNKFSDSVTLCKTNLSDTLGELNASLEELSKAEVTEEKEILFQRIIDVIRQKFNLTEDNPEINCVSLIKWCISNNLIQQAITIYTEKIPEYLYENDYFTISPVVKKEFEEKKTVYPFCYEVFYNGFMAIMSKSKKGTTPFSGFLKNMDGRVFKALKESNDIEQFKRRLPYIKQDSSFTKEVQQGIKNFFRIKRSMYDENGTRFADDVIERKFKLIPEFKTVPFMINAKNTEGFINSLKSNTDACETVQGEFEKDYTYDFDKLNTIVYLEKALKNNIDYRISSKLTIKKMQELLSDYLYIKIWIRNMVNHASEESENKQDLINYFDVKGYNTKESLTTSEIKQILMNALKKLEM